MVDKYLGVHDVTVCTKPTLDRLLLDPCLLNRVRFFRRARTFKRGDPGTFKRTYRSYARTDGFSVSDNRAHATLTHAASEFRAVQVEIIAQDIKKR